MPIGCRRTAGPKSGWTESSSPIARTIASEPGGPALRRRADSTGWRPGRSGTRRSRRRVRACPLSWHPPMRLLVTGGAGYIGSIVAQQLVARGDDVTVLDSLYKRPPRGRARRARRSSRPTCSTPTRSPRCSTTRLRRRRALRRAVARRRVGRVPRALLPRQRRRRAEPARRDARARASPRLVFSSTAATYGEPDVELIAEDTPNQPVNAYGNSKLAVDRMLADEARAHGLAAVSLRYFNVAGASGPLGEDHDARDAPDPAGAAGRGRASARASRSSAPTTRRRTAPRCATTSTSTTSARAHLLALEKAVPRAATTSTTSAPRRGYSVREVIETARRVTGREIVALEEDRRAGDPPRLVAAEREGAGRARLGARAVARGHGPRRLGVAPGAPGRLLSRAAPAASRRASSTNEGPMPLIASSSASGGGWRRTTSRSVASVATV